MMIFLMIQPSRYHHIHQIREDRATGGRRISWCWAVSRMSNSGTGIAGPIKIRCNRRNRPSRDKQVGSRRRCRRHVHRRHGNSHRDSSPGNNRHHHRERSLPPPTLLHRRRSSISMFRAGNLLHRETAGRAGVRAAVPAA